jgi:hypothetical protein
MPVSAKSFYEQMSGVDLNGQYSEAQFQKWYAAQAAKLGLNKDPDDPRHFYSYRDAYKSGAVSDDEGHFPSKFKLPGHPNRFVGGVDTIDSTIATAEKIAANKKARSDTVGGTISAKSFYEQMSGGRTPDVSTGAPSAILPAATGTQGIAPPENLLPKDDPVSAGVDVETGAPAWERMLASFYSSPQGKQYVLSKKYGDENTRIDKGKAQFKNPSTGKWTALDEKGLTGRDFVDFIGDVPEITAGILGELGGVALGGPVGAIPGAGVGQVGGAGMKRLIQSLIGKTEEFKPVEEFALGAGSQAVSMGAAKLLGKALKPVNVDAARGAATEAAESAGIGLTAAQKSGSPMVQGAQDLIERMPMANRTQGIIDKGIQDFGDFSVREVTDKFGARLTEKQMGKIHQDAFHSSVMALRSKAKVVYDKVWSRVADEGLERSKVMTSNLTNVAAQIAEDIKGGHIKDEGTAQFLEFLTSKEVAEGRTLSQMSDIRSSILSAGRDIPRIFDKGKRYFNMLNEAAQKDIEAWGTKYSKDIVKELSDANSLYKEEMSILADPVLGNLLARSESKKLAPETVPGLLMGKKNVSKMEAARKIVGEETWKKMQGFAAHDLIQKGTIKGVGDVDIISPSKLRTAISKLGEDELKMFSPMQQDALKNISKIGSLFTGAQAASANPSGTAQAIIKTNMVKELLVSLGIGGGTASATGSYSTGAAASMMSAAPFLSSVLQSKPVLRYLSDGYMDLTPKRQRVIAGLARTAIVTIVNNVVRKSELKEKKPPAPSLKGL